MAHITKLHPTLDILVNSVGLVFVPQNRSRKAHWTPGWLNSDGYLSVTVDGKSYLVHRLVAETFIENKEGKPTVDHRDRCRTNNSVSNLKWATLHEQQINTDRTENSLKLYGVRSCDDFCAYVRARRQYIKAHKAA